MAKDPAKDRFLHSGCISCCFRGGRQEAADGGGGGERRRLVRASSSWLRSRAQDIPELREKCRSLISRMGRRSGRPHPDDFRYDALSYAMNFDEGEDEGLVGDFRYSNFSSRLAPTPPPASPPWRSLPASDCRGPSSIHANLSDHVSIEILRFA